MFWKRKPEPVEIEESPEFLRRLHGVVTRARAVQIDETRHAIGAGPDGALWGDTTAAVVHLNDRLLAAA